MIDYMLDLIYEIETCPEDYRWFGMLLLITGSTMIALGVVLVAF